MATFKYILLLMTVLISTIASSQSATFISHAYPSNFGCNNGDTLTGNQTPMWNVNLQSNPSASQLINVDIPSGGYGECCNYPDNYSCLVLEILISPDAGGVNFTLAGASGNTYIQYVNCSSTPVQAGTPICISGVGPHYFMFCRTGTTDYSITVQSIPSPSGVGDLTTTEGCNIQLGVDGLIPSTVTWSTINPGTANQFNNYISNLSGGQIGTSGVLYDQDLTDVLISPPSGGPSSIVMQVCGEPFINSICPATSPDTWCTTSTITIYPDLFATPGPNAVLCNGSVTGTIASVTASGGTAPYTYTWTGPNGFSQTHTHTSTVDNITAMVAGIYTVVINDATDCPTATTTVTVTQYNVDIIANAGTDKIVCGSPTPTINLVGSVSATGTGVWSGGNGTYSTNTSDLTLSYTPTAAEVLAGSVSLTLTPTNTSGCPYTSDQVTINLTEFSSTLVVVPTSVSCAGMSNGSINLTVNPGFPAYSTTAYSWSNGATTQDISNLPTGTYSVIVTDVNGCKGTASATITQPSPLSSSIVSQTNVSCFGGNNGSVTISGVNGTAPYTYSLGGSPAQTSGTFSGLTIGSYTVTITDANGCTVNQAFTMTQPTAMNTSLVPSVYAGGYNLSGCTPDGSINLSVSGGSPGYTYAWSNGATSQDISNLSAGAYSVVITDINGCQTTSNITLTQPGGLSQTISATTYPSGTNISCNGLSNGSINLTVSGGSPGYTYLWNTGQVTQDLSGVPAGTYNVIITDANGCQIVSSIILTQPAPLTQTASAFTYPSGTNISCFGLSDGNIDLTIGGGNPGFTYSWSTGATTQDLNNLPAGSYTATVTDLNGCTITSSITLTQPAVIASSVTPSLFAGGYNLSGCDANGSINLSVSGGNPGYSYSWSTGQIVEDISDLAAGSYSVTVTDINGCQTTNNITLTQPSALSQTISAYTYPSGTNISCFGLSNGSVNLTVTGGTPGYTYLWSSGQVSQDLASVPAGSYNVTITDANGCQITSSITLNQPIAFTQSITAYTYSSGMNISCFGLSDGSIDYTIGGGNPGYTYSWSNGAATQDLNSVAAGNYIVTITDINGCTTTSNITLTQPPLLTTNLTPSVYAGGYNLSGCNADGSIDLTVAGGNPGYTYSWSNGQIIEDLSNLAAGTYNITVTDMNGCQATSNITLTQPGGLSQTISAFTYPSGTNISCNGLSNGSINLTVSGGTPGYTYQWGGGQTTQDLSNVPAGSYNVLITDASGCQIYGNITLTQPAPLTETSTPFTYPSGTNISCYGLSDGSIDLTIGGGNPGYTYSWSNGNSTQDLSNLPFGTYNCTVTDVNGCTITSNIQLIQPPLITSSLSPSVYAGGYNLSGCNADGAINLSVSGGNPGYSFSWSNGQNIEDLSNLPSGPYTVNVTDMNGCQTTSSVTLTQPGGLTQSITAYTYPSGTHISCYGLSNGSINLTVSGGTPGYTYLWNNGQSTQDLTGVPAGAYSVLITDASGCQVTGNITLVQPDALTESISAFSYPSGTNISCFGLSDGSINLSIAGGNPGYTFSWSNGATTEDLNGIQAGTYMATITDLNGCMITSDIVLTQPSVLSSSAVLSVYAGGYNLSGCNPDGTIDLTVVGGNAGFSYSWSNGNTTQDVSNLGAGYHNVTVTDINGCQTMLDTNLTQPPSLIVTTQVVSNYNGEDISCFGATDGAVTVNILGGTPTFDYEWLDSNDLVISNAQSPSGLSSGLYTVNIQDQNGCFGTNTVLVTEPPMLASDINVSTNYHGEHISCYGFSDGGINLSLTGGTPGYSYNWTNSFGDTISTVQDPQAIPAGVYTVAVSDANGCLLFTDIELTQPTPLIATTEILSDYNGQDVSCNGATDGLVSVTPSGGTPTYTNTWINSVGTPLGTNQNLATVGQGTFYVDITDLNGCVYTTNVIVTEPPLLTSGTTIITDFNGMGVSCEGQFDGIAEVFYEGGTSGYTFEWNTSPVQTTLQATNLGVGTYTVEVTDANGCVSTSYVEMIANPLPTFNLPEGINSCMGAGVFLDSHAEPGSSCTWEFSDGQVVQECGPITVLFPNQECYDMSLTVTSPMGCINSTSIEDFICVKPNPDASFYTDESELSNMDGATHFWNTSTGADHYTWDFGDESPNVYTYNTYHEFYSNDDFNTLTFPVVLTAHTEYGCIDTAIVYINLSPDLIIYVPNAFTPDQDHLNNTFRPIFGSGYSDEGYLFTIYNRWGEVVYETRDIREGWDGTYAGNVVQDGVFTWKLKGMYSINEEKFERIGHVSLLR